MTGGKNKLQDFALSSQNCDHWVLQLIVAPVLAKAQERSSRNTNRPYSTCMAPVWASPHPCPRPRTPTRSAWGHQPQWYKRSASSLGGPCKGMLQLVYSCVPGPSHLCFWLGSLVYHLPWWTPWSAPVLLLGSVPAGWVQSARTTHGTKIQQKVLKMPNCSLILIQK